MSTIHSKWWAPISSTRILRSVTQAKTVVPLSKTKTRKHTKLLIFSNRTIANHLSAFNTKVPLKILNNLWTSIPLHRKTAGNRKDLTEGNFARLTTFDSKKILIDWIHKKDSHLLTKINTFLWQHPHHDHHIDLLFSIFLIFHLKKQLN